MYSDSCSWSRTEIKDLGHLIAHSKNHKENNTHIHNVLNLTALENVNIATQLSCGYHDAIHTHNEKVKKNRYIHSRIEDCIKF